MTHDNVVFHGSKFPFPFENGTFPRQLGAVVMRSVLEGEMPALQVVHFPDGDWGIVDAVHDPNEKGALVLTHMWDMLDRDPSLLELASMPPGYQADRDAPGMPWNISPFEFAPD